MALEVGAILGAAIPLVGGLFGNSQQNAERRAARRAQERAAKDAQELVKWENETARLNYEYALKIRDFEYDQNLRIFDKSKEIYGLQLAYNTQAASRAYAAENRKMDEYLMGLAFTKQDMLVDMLKQKGSVQSFETAGKSTQRLMRDVLGQFGRDNEILAENLVSYNRQYQENLSQIGFQKQGADMDAYSRLGLEPLKPPPVPKPIKKPVPGGAVSAPNNSGLQIASTVTSALAAGLQSGMASKAAGFGFWGGSLF